MTSIEAIGFMDEVDRALVRSPKVFACHEAWVAMRPAADVLPGRQHFDPAAMGRLLANILTLDIVRDGGDDLSFKFRLIGTAIRDAYGEDMTGEAVGAGGLAPRHHMMAAETGRAVWRLAPPLQPVLQGRVHMVENLVLPLAKDGKTPDVLVFLAIFFDQAGREFRPYRKGPRSG